MVEDFGLIRKSMKQKLGRKVFSTPEGQIVLMLLKMSTDQSYPKLMEQLNVDFRYQMFCDVIINSARLLTDCKRFDDIMIKIARVRVPAIEGSFGTQKEHYGLEACQTQNEGGGNPVYLLRLHKVIVVQPADKIEQRTQLASA